MFVSDNPSSVAMKSLKEICKLAVIKQGISKTELPKTVAKEVEVVEENIKSLLTGTFSVKTTPSSLSTLPGRMGNGNCLHCIRRQSGSVLVEASVDLVQVS